MRLYCEHFRCKMGPEIEFCLYLEKGVAVFDMFPNVPKFDASLISVK